MIHLVDGDSELFLDDGLAPILVATWIGPATLTLCDEFHRWSDEQVAAAKRAGRPMILVNDGSAAGRPSADVRRAFAEHEVDKEVTFRTFVVITNPLVRGAMTAIGWIVGDAFDVLTCRTMDDAFEHASAFAREHQLVPPAAELLANYSVRDSARSA